MLAGITPVAKKALEATAGPEIPVKSTKDFSTASPQIMVDIWQHFLGLGVGPPSIRIPSLLHTHSTICLQRQRFPASPLERWDFTCIRSGCLSHDSDDYQALAKSHNKYGVPSHSRIAHRIWCLLHALDLPLQPMLSRFFEERFSERCAAVLRRLLTNCFRWEAPKVATPTFDFHSCVTASVLFLTQ